MATPNLPESLAAKTLPRRAAPARRAVKGDLLGSLKIWQKLLLISLAFVLPLLVSVGLLINQQNQRISFAEQKLRGVAYLTPLREVLEGVQLHRGVAARELGGDLAARDERLELVARINRSLADVAAVDTLYGQEFGSSNLLNTVQDNWEMLTDGFASLTPAESTQRHIQILLQGIEPLLLQVANRSNLILDSEIDTHYVMDLAVNRMVDALNSVGLVRTMGVQGASRGTSTDVQKTEMTLRLAEGEADLVAVARSLRFAFEASPFAREQLEPQVARTQQAVDAMIGVYRANVLDVEQATVSGPEFFNLAFDSFEQQQRLHAETVRVLASLLQIRVQTLQRNQLVTLSLIALFVGVLFVLVATVARRISGPIGQLFAASTRLSTGDLTVHVPVTSRDEVGALARTFNETVKQLRLKAETDAADLESSNRLQGNISNFLNVATEIAAGDFTKRGEVSADVLGNVVDSVNLVVEEIGYVLRDVQGAALSVRERADGMIRTSEAITGNTQLQASEAQRANHDVQVVTASLKQVATDAASSAQASRQALLASQQGQEAVNNTLTGMQGIRREVQLIAKRMKGLGDRSLEISEIVETIARISRQTNLLALNAAIEAAGAGEAGGRFAIVADEVRKLAENSQGATQRIAALIRSVQGEVQEVIAGVEDGTREVESGYRVALEAGERLTEIGTISQRAAQLAETIAQATQVQVPSMEGASGAVTSIASIAQEAQTSAQEGREAAETLRKLALELTHSLERFRLA